MKSRPWWTPKGAATMPPSERRGAEGRGADLLPWRTWNAGTLPSGKHDFYGRLHRSRPTRWASPRPCCCHHAMRASRALEEAKERWCANQRSTSRVRSAGSRGGGGGGALPAVWGSSMSLSGGVGEQRALSATWGSSALSAVCGSSALSPSVRSKWLEGGE